MVKLKLRRLDETGQRQGLCPLVATLARSQYSNTVALSFHYFYIKQNIYIMLFFKFGNCPVQWTYATENGWPGPGPLVLYRTFFILWMINELKHYEIM